MSDVWAKLREYIGVPEESPASAYDRWLFAKRARDTIMDERVHALDLPRIVPISSGGRAASSAYEDWPYTTSRGDVLLPEEVNAWKEMLEMVGPPSRRAEEATTEDLIREFNIQRFLNSPRTPKSPEYPVWQMMPFEADSGPGGFLEAANDRLLNLSRRR